LDREVVILITGDARALARARPNQNRLSISLLGLGLWARSAREHALFRRENLATFSGSGSGSRKQPSAIA
jgi:hypothetical protein